MHRDAIARTRARRRGRNARALRRDRALRGPSPRALAAMSVVRCVEVSAHDPRQRGLHRARNARAAGCPAGRPHARRRLDRFELDPARRQKGSIRTLASHRDDLQPRTSTPCASGTTSRRRRAKSGSTRSATKRRVAAGRRRHPHRGTRTAGRLERRALYGLAGRRPRRRRRRRRSLAARPKRLSAIPRFREQST